MWPFRRSKPMPPAPPPFIKPKDDWRPGDLAQCIVNREGWFCPNLQEIASAPERGDVLLVHHVAIAPGIFGTIGVGLIFPHRSGIWDATCFRKLRPCADELDHKAAGKQPVRRALETVD